MDISIFLKSWQKLSRFPGGKLLFSKALGRAVPYSGSISPEVEVLEPGHAIVAMADRRRVRNHLSSVHAIALVNVAEVSSGLALLSGLPKGARGILTGFSIRYLKKARGTIRAETLITDLPAVVSERFEKKIQVILRNEASEVVAEAEASWTVGPEKSEAKSEKV